MLGALLRDLVRRVEVASREIMHLVIDTEVTMTPRDIAEKVERALPPGYPAPTVGPSRLDFIEQIAHDVLTGDLYEDAPES